MIWFMIKKKNLSSCSNDGSEFTKKQNKKTHQYLNISKEEWIQVVNVTIYGGAVEVPFGPLPMLRQSWVYRWEMSYIYVRTKNFTIIKLTRYYWFSYRLIIDTYLLSTINNLPPQTIANYVIMMLDLLL